MNLQSQLRESKQQIRSFIRANWDDQKLHDVYAFNADGKMSYFSGCNCLMGVTLSNKLHHRMCDEVKLLVSCWDLVTGTYLPQFGSHYSRAHALPDAKNAERAYHNLGHGSVVSLYGEESPYSMASDGRRKRRLSAILRAEIKRRSRLNPVTGNPLGTDTVMYDPILIRASS